MVDTIQDYGYVDAKTLVQLAAVTQSLKQRTLELLHIKPGDHVLDVGCGPGIDTMTLGHLVGRAGFVAGVDHDEIMVREANLAAHQAGISVWTKHMIAEASSLPYQAAAFDAVRSDRLFQHVRRAHAVLAEMVRVTRTGGRIAVADADWGTLSVDTAETTLERQICRALPGLLSNGYAGRALFRLFREQPITHLAVEVHPIVWTDYATFRRTSLSPLNVERRLVDSGAVSWDEWNRFLTILEEAEHRGCFFASGNMVLVAGTRA